MKEMDKKRDERETTVKSLIVDNNENAVNHPSHYNIGKIEVIDFIEDLGLSVGFNLGNAIKYLSRAGYKDSTKTIEDLEKAIWYCQRQINFWQQHKENVETLTIGRIKIFDYIEDKGFYYNVGRAIEFIREALNAGNGYSPIKALEKACDCIQREINKLND